MRRIIIICTIFIIFFNENVLADVYSNLKDRLNIKSDFFAKFIQKITDSNGNNIQQGYGYLWVKRPNLFNWHMIYPNEYIIISDGITLWLYDPYIKQVNIFCLKDFINSTPLTLIVRNLKSDWKKYNITQKGDKFTLIPKSNHQNIKRLIINVSLSGTIRQLSVIEWDDQCISYALKMKKNCMINSSKFRFSLPNDVTIDDQR